VLLAVAGRTQGYPKPMSESDGTVSDAPGDRVDATPHTSPSTENIDDLVNRKSHEKADMLLARSTVSGIYRISSYITGRSNCYTAANFATHCF